MALGRPGGAIKFVVGALGASWGEKVVDFTLPEAPGRVPEWLWEVILGAFFREGLPARKK